MVKMNLTKEIKKLERKEQRKNNEELDRLENFIYRLKMSELGIRILTGEEYEGP